MHGSSPYPLHFSPRRMKNRVAAEIEEAVVELAIEQPAFAQQHRNHIRRPMSAIRHPQ
jgi:hypothetical protein